jgi:hypothetical protein
MPKNDPYDPDDTAAASDADALQKAEEIKSDPDRHAKAHAHLSKKKDAVNAAHKQSRKALEAKVGKKMQETFYPKDQDEPDSNAAGKDGAKMSKWNGGSGAQDEGPYMQA